MDAHSEPEFPDALPSGPLRGRGAGLNPGNRFEPVRLHVLGEHLDEQIAESSSDCPWPTGRRTSTTFYEDTSRTVLNRVDSPDAPYGWTVNPYRGCEHGCIYCYARPSHEYLGFSSGLDFETKIMVKTRAPELLAEALSRPTWRNGPGARRERIAISGVTDPYQPIERTLRLTRRCLEVCLDFRQPVSITTKNAAVLRDLDVLLRLHEHRLIHVVLSLTTLDRDLARTMEPRTSSPRARLDAIRRLSASGVPVRAMIAPIIPGLNDRELPALLRSAAEAGATAANYLLLRLPYQNKALFLDWLRRHYPDRAAHVESLVRQTRGGRLNDSTPQRRFTGQGPIAEQIRRTFEVFARRYGLVEKREGAPDRPCGPRDQPQLRLFER